MPSYFYRFRSINALLGEFKELERQEIYFAPSQDLNDGLEGLTNVVWRGDAILWRNLLRHYILILLASTMDTLLGKERATSEQIGLMVEMTDAEFEGMPVHGIYQAVSEEFLALPEVQTWIDGMVSREAVLTREDLIGFLRPLHISAFEVVSAAMEAQGIKVLIGTLDFSALKGSISEVVGARFGFFDKGEDGREFLRAGMDTAAEQLDLTRDFADPQITERFPILFLIRDFPASYVRALEGMLFPSWSTACFVRDPQHTTMWGVYGDSHRGICLKFRAREDADRRPSLKLIGSIPAEEGSGERKGGDQPEQTVTRNLAFRPVRYSTDYPEIDFFRSLGRLPRFKLTDFWYSNGQGATSERVRDVLAENPEWRRDYWERHAQISTTKLPQWAHEGESRLVLERDVRPGGDDMAQRKLRYEMADLAGVIFGVKTTQVEKIATLRTLANNALKAGGATITFEQAEYSHQTGRINIQPLKLLSDWFAKNWGKDAIARRAS